MYHIIQNYRQTPKPKYNYVFKIYEGSSLNTVYWRYVCEKNS